MADARLPAIFQVEENPAVAWAEWREDFLMYLHASEKVGKPPNVTIAILLNAMGREGRRIYQTFHFPEDVKLTLSMVIAKFDEHFQSGENFDLQRFKFGNKKQEGETISEYITNLKLMIKKCNYGNLSNSLLKTQLVSGLKDRELQQTLILNKDWDLDKIIDYCKNYEQSKLVCVEIQNHNNNENNVHYVNSSKHRNSDTKFQNKKCSRCGTNHLPRNCPAFNKTCFKCSKLNHFASVCRNKSVNMIFNNNVTSDLNNGTGINPVDTIQIHANLTYSNNSWFENLKIQNLEVKFKLDTGSSINVLPFKYFSKLQDKIILKECMSTVSSYSGHNIEITGICSLVVKFKNIQETLEFYVINYDAVPILGLDGCQKLNIIKRIDNINNSLMDEFEDVFDNFQIGKLPFEYSLHLSKDAVPRISAPRVIPKALQKLVKEELENLLSQGVLVHVKNEPSTWVHPIVVVKKSENKVRIVMDPRHLNKYILRNIVRMPTKETIFSELEGAKYFSVLDASAAFMQIPLSEESSRLCTIATPWGTMRYTRLPYGLSCSSEIFTQCMNDIFQGLPGVCTYVDDILIFGKTLDEHNQNLKNVLIKAREYNLRFSKKKVQFCVQQIKYLGFILSSDGIAIDSSKLESIQNFKPPSNKVELQRFLGMINYFNQFLANMSELTAPLRALLKKDAVFVWEVHHQNCFEKLRSLLTEAPVLRFYDANSELVISVDASNYGIGGCALQNGHPVAFTSSTLNDAQQSYSQIEKELLAIQVCCSKFDYYCYGRKFLVQSDHKPLVGLLKKPMDTLSPRLQRLVLKLLRYDFEIIYVPGKNLTVADTLSRAPLSYSTDTSFLKETYFKIDSIVSISPQRITDLVTATKNDTCLNQIMSYCKNGWPEHKANCLDICKNYFSIRHAIHLQDEILFFNNRIIVPSIMRGDILNKIHLAHQGIVTCKSRARQAVYWPGLMKEIENLVNACTQCQGFSRSNIKQYMYNRPIPELPWQEVSIDFMLVNNKNFMVLVDSFSKFVQVRYLHSKSAVSVVSNLKEIFGTHGLPQSLLSDNGPPFDSHIFTQFLKDYDITHITSSPFYPQSNGLVERTIATVKSILTKSPDDYHMLILEHNNSPKYDTMSPAKCLMGRTLRSVLPVSTTQLLPDYDIKPVQRALIQHQTRQANYYNQHKTNLVPLQINQPVYVQLDKHKWVPATVINTCNTPNSYVIKTEDNRIFRRNRFHLKPRKLPIQPTPVNVNNNNNNLNMPLNQGNCRPHRNIRKPSRFND